MNHRELPQVPQGMRWTIHLLVGLLVAALTGMGLVNAHAGTRYSPALGCSAAPSTGYLPAHGAPPLRFAEVIIPATPAIQLAVEVPAASKSSANSSSGSPTSPADHPASADVSVHAPSSSGVTVISSSPEKPAPLSILPDDARRQVRPEDFLPYFQIPGSRGNPDVTLLVPASLGQPANPPPQTSSATYLQTDK